MNRYISDDIMSLVSKTPELILKSVAERVRLRRLEKNWTQQLLASKTNIPLATYRRFERTGEVSFRSLVKIAFALGMEDDFGELFAKQSYQSVDELLNASKVKQRRRGGKNE